MYVPYISEQISANHLRVKNILQSENRNCPTDVFPFVSMLFIFKFSYMGIFKFYIK